VRTDDEHGVDHALDDAQWVQVDVQGKSVDFGEDVFGRRLFVDGCECGLGGFVGGDGGGFFFFVLVFIIV
jgi:hypothetical protein